MPLILFSKGIIPSHPPTLNPQSKISIKSRNISKIQYLSATGTKIYKVTDIDFHNLIIEATETDLSIADVPESEVFPIEEFGEFRIRDFINFCSCC